MDITEIKTAEQPKETEELDAEAERDDQQADGLENLIASLRAEKDVSEEDEFYAGKAAGRQYANQASYHEFKAYEADMLEETHNPTQFGWSGGLPESEEEILVDFLLDGEVVSGAIYRQGWLVGMGEIWAQVRNKI